MAGNIEKRGKGSWRLTVNGGIGPDGKRIKHQKTVKASSEREAKKELAKFVAEIEKGEYHEPSRMTLSEYVEFWLTNYGETNLQPTTIVFYKGLFKRILTAMGHLKLEQIKPIHLIQFYKNLEEDGIREDGKPGGLSSQMILHHHRCFSAILQDAVEWQLISSNPVSKVKAPKVEIKEGKYYTEEEVSAILTHLSQVDIKYFNLVSLGIATGLRKGELLGLEWKHIDFQQKTIKVCQSSQYTRELGVFTKLPKNKSSNRVIAIPNSILTMLSQYKDYQESQRLEIGDLWENHDRLFTQWNGKPMHPGTVNSWFQKFLIANDLPRRKFHSLRHTSATLLIAHNVNLKTVSERLGHARIETTLNVYGHALRKADYDAADKMDEVLFSNLQL